MCLNKCVCVYVCAKAYVIEKGPVILELDTYRCVCASTTVYVLRRTRLRGGLSFGAGHLQVCVYMSVCVFVFVCATVCQIYRVFG